MIERRQPTPSSSLEWTQEIHILQILKINKRRCIHLTTVIGLMMDLCLKSTKEDISNHNQAPNTLIRTKYSKMWVKKCLTMHSRGIMPVSSLTDRRDQERVTPSQDMEKTKELCQELVMRFSKELMKQRPVVLLMLSTLCRSP